MPDKLDRGQLLALLTTERLGSYFDACDGDRDRALDLYEWNIEASAAVVSMAAMLEVVLRNALDRQMSAWASRKELADWLTTAPLDDRAKQDIRQARERAARGGKTPTHGHVVAELNLGFWRYLVSRRYLTPLWIPALNAAFPHARSDARTVQREVESHVQQLLFLRNRAAHHEPIHRRDLRTDLDRALLVARYIHPVAASWLAARESMSEVLARRPPHGSG